jgi:anti-sigma B factor antagonist
MDSSSSADVFRVEVEERGSAIVARLIGSAGMLVSTDLEDALLELVGRQPPLLILDLSGLEFISSVGLGGIVAAHLRSRHHGGAIYLVAPTADIHDLLATTRLTSIFPIFDTIDQALAGKGN